MPLLADRYELGPLLGSGGMADVYEARDLRLSRRVAVKILRVDVTDTVRRERFEREARALATVAHPGAVAVYDAGEDDDRPYIVMELVDGTTLASEIRTGRGFPPDEVRAIGDQILAALEHLHDHGIVHRDIKPANVLIGDDARVRLADFGIAKTFADASSDLTLTGLVIGTVRYLAPEVAAGEPATPRSDLFSVGVVLDEMLRNAAARPEVDPLAPTELLETVAPIPIGAQAIASVVNRALQHDPSQRFATAHDMRGALATTADAATAVMPAATFVEPTVPAPVSPAPVPPPPAQRPPARPNRRRRVLAAALASVVVAAVVTAFALSSESSPRAGAHATGPPPSGAGAGAPSTTPSSAPSTATAPRAKPAVTAPGSIPELLALLAANPDQFGTKGRELETRLQQFVSGPQQQTERRRTHLVNDITAWTNRGELSSVIGTAATQLLAATAPPPSARHGENSGEGGD